MRLAIYGGSFNPPHMGHVGAARSVYEQLRPDKFLIIPTNVPPHKELEANSPSPAQRLEFCEMAFSDIPGAEISDMEIRREGRSYTAETVDVLRGQYPGAELCIVMGTDMFLSFRTWFRWQDMLGTCTLAVLSREDDDREEIEAFKARLERENGAKILLVPHEPLPMSSTGIRALLREGKGSAYLPEKVYRRILRKGFYGAKAELSWLRDEVVRDWLDERRVPHVLGVERQAIALAERWGEDVYNAAAAGILHDVTKNQKKEKQLKLCEKYGIMPDKAEVENPALLHALTGAAVAKDRFGASDVIADSIRWHTTGKPDMTRLEKIIYLADYVEPTRDFEGVEPLRALCFEDLDRAMALGLRMSLEEIRSRGAEPFRDTVEAYEWYKHFEQEELQC